MVQITRVIILITSLFCTQTLSREYPQDKDINVLKNNITAILKDKNATVGVAISSKELPFPISINGDEHLPMQSVFKYHLALAVLSQVDKEKLSLSDKITITPKELNNNLWSPIRKKYPNGATLTLAEVLRYTIAYSDNVGCDVLFNMLGGPKVVEHFLHQNGIIDIAIEYDEFTQQQVWERQYKNWTTAISANKTLKMFYENNDKVLSEKSHQFLWDTMKSSGTGKHTIKGKLPKSAIVAHKTGSSGSNEAGLTAAQNDIGIVFLPSGKYFYISILVSDSTESRAVNKEIIADISKQAWDYFEQ